MLLRDLLSVSYCICPVMTLSSVHTLSLYGQSKLWFWVSAMNIVLVRWHYTVYAKSVYEKCSVVSLNWFYGQESSYSTNIMGVTVLRINVIEKHLQIKGCSFVWLQSYINFSWSNRKEEMSCVKLIQTQFVLNQLTMMFWLHF